MNISNQTEIGITSDDRIVSTTTKTATTPTSSILLSSPSGRDLLDSDEALLQVTPDFPPTIDPKALGVALFNKRRKSKKMLNEFFIYRKEFVKELKKLNIRPKQTRVSSLASASWHRQPPNVKDEYRRLARETERCFMAERQQEANRMTCNESPKTDSNESSPDDTTPLSSPLSDPDPFSAADPDYQPLNHQQMQANYYAPILDNNQLTSYPLQQNYIWGIHTTPVNYLYYDPSSVQETNNYFDNYNRQ